MVALRHIVVVGLLVVGGVPLVKPGDAHQAHRGECASGVAFLARPPPAEDADETDAAAHVLGQGDGDVAVVGDEAVAVARAVGMVGHRHHVAALECETLDGVVEVAQAVVIGAHLVKAVGLAAQVDVGIYGEGMAGDGVGEYDGAVAVGLHSAVDAVDCGGAVDLYVAQPVGQHLGRPDVGEYHRRAVVGDVDGARHGGIPFQRRDGVVDVVVQGDARLQLRHGYLAVPGRVQCRTVVGERTADGVCRGGVCSPCQHHGEKDEQAVFHDGCSG